jgi:CheY-like chemotaxis protein
VITPAPADDQSLGSSPHRSRGARVTERRTSVLIVEDDEDIRESLGDALELDGYDVAAAENGWEALRLLRSGLAPDVILLDLVMPVMNGWQFRKAQLADPEIMHIPVVVVSASAPGDACPDRHLPKPFGIDDLLSTVSSLATRA